MMSTEKNNSSSKPNMQHIGRFFIFSQSNGYGNGFRLKQLSEMEWKPPITNNKNKNKNNKNKIKIKKQEHLKVEGDLERKDIVEEGIQEKIEFETELVGFNKVDFLNDVGVERKNGKKQKEENLVFVLGNNNNNNGSTSTSDNVNNTSMDVQIRTRQKLASKTK
eukprot:Pgem_evm1s4772